MEKYYLDYYIVSHSPHLLYLSEPYREKVHRDSDPNAVQDEANLVNRILNKIKGHKFYVSNDIMKLIEPFVDTYIDCKFEDKSIFELSTEDLESSKLPDGYSIKTVDKNGIPSPNGKEKKIFRDKESSTTNLANPLQIYVKLKKII